MRTPAKARAGALRVGIIGAGGYARLGHLPNISRLHDLYTIRAVADLNGAHSSDVARQYGAKYATTDYKNILADSEVDAVLIATRHDTHARLAEEAIRAGKAVYVEKPMATNREELASLVAAIREYNGKLIVGFNRRFSPLMRGLREAVADRRGPLIVNYIVAAGPIPPDNWTHGPEGGGRIVGEACHMFDVFSFLVDCPIMEVRGRGVGIEPGTRDNAVVCLVYQDGSVCNLIYTPFGGRGFPKETIHVLWDGGAAVINDFRALGLFAKAETWRRSRTEQKGRREIWQAFGLYLKGQSEAPISLEHMISATETSFRITESLFGVEG